MPSLTYIAPEGSKVKANSDTGIDEEATLESMEHLQWLHVTLRNLRQTLPGLMGCLQPPYGPEELYSGFTTQAEAANNDIREFIKLLKDERTKQAFEQVKSSRERDSENIKAWRFTEHANWLTIPKRFEGALGLQSVSDLDPMDIDVPRDEGISETVQRFKDMFKELVIAIDDENRVIRLALPPPANLDFQIEQKLGDAQKETYEVRTEASSMLNKKIVDVVNSRHKNLGLMRLLDMLASYADITRRLCIKCARLIDEDGQFPVLRVERKGRTNEPAEGTAWDALHASCK